jgi:hypothetical protein
MTTRPASKKIGNPKIRDARPRAKGARFLAEDADKIVGQHLRTAARFNDAAQHGTQAY